MSENETVYVSALNVVSKFECESAKAFCISKGLDKTNSSEMFRQAQSLEPQCARK